MTRTTAHKQSLTMGV